MPFGARIEPISLTEGDAGCRGRGRRTDRAARSGTARRGGKSGRTATGSVDHGKQERRCRKNREIAIRKIRRVHRENRASGF